MRKTNFTFFSLLLLAFTLTFSSLSAQTTSHALASLCDVTSMVVNDGDVVRGEWEIGDCVDNFGSGITLEPGYYHCKSVTHLVPNDGERVTVKFMQDFQVGYENDRFVTGRIMILNGNVNENLANSSCTGRLTADVPASGTIASSEDILFDSQRDGNNYAALTNREFTSSAPDGQLTVVVLLFSTDLASVPLEVVTTSDATAADCKLACNDNVNISLNSGGKRGLTYHDVINGGHTGCYYVVEIAYPYASMEDMYPNKDTVDCWMIGGEFVYRVIDTMTQNSCWGYIKVEDKFPPNLICRDTAIHCWEAENFGVTASSDNCSYEVETTELSKKWVDFNCENPDTIGYIERSVIAQDIWGNSIQCDSQRLYVLRESIDSLYCNDSLYVIECCQNSGDDISPGGADPEDLWDEDLVWYDEWGYAHPKVLIRPGIGHNTESYGLVPPPYIVNNGWIGHLDSDEPDDVNTYNPYGKCNIVAPL